MPDRSKVLIIDDETDLCLLLKDYFVRKNYNVAFAHTLADGQELLREVNPHILFLDNNLPDGLGWKVAPQIALGFPSMYIVLISAFHPSVPEMPEKANFRAIEKPIRFSDLDQQFSEF